MSSTPTRRTFTVKKTSAEVRQAFDRIPHHTDKYKLKRSRENVYRFESSPYFGLIIHIDASYFPTPDDHTDVTFEIKPSHGEFNHRHDMNQAFQHLDNMVELFYYCTRFHRTVS